MGRLGKAEVAKKIGAKVRTLEQMIHDEEFPDGVQLGRSKWWLEEVVDDWLDLTFAPQKDWVSRKRAGIGQRGDAGCASAPGVVSPAPTVAGRAPKTGSKKSTALKCAAVPPPVRLA